MASHIRDALRKIASHAQYGAPVTPRTLGISDSYCDYHWSWSHREMDFATWKLAARLAHRYQRFCHYVTDVAPQWQEERKIHFADNSVESVQVSKDGRRRQVMDDGPHGDVCF